MPSFRKHNPRRLLALTVVALGMMLGVPAWAAPPTPRQAGVGRMSVPAEEKQRLRAAKMDPALLELAEATRGSREQAREAATRNELRVVENRVQVYVFIQPDRKELAVRRIREAGGEVTKTAHDDSFLQAWLPLDRLDSIAALPEVLILRRPVLSQPMIGASSTPVLGTMNAASWHAKGIWGNGVKVAVIDSGFKGYNTLVASGDLPAGAIRKNFVDGETTNQIDATTTHGAACAEIVHDIAPGAQLYLVKAATTADTQEALNWLISEQVQIISHSGGFSLANGAPGDGTGFFQPLIDQAQANGILWINSAGNVRKGHWSGTFLDPDGDDLLNFTDNVSSSVNQFVDAAGIPLLIPAGKKLSFELRWSDWGTPTNDFDMYLWKRKGTGSWTHVPQSPGEGVAVQDGTPGQQPVEYIEYAVPETAHYGVTIQRHDADKTDLNFDLFAVIPDFPLEQLSTAVETRSIFPPADVASAMTVSAVEAVAPHLQPFYSSEGPTNGPGGTAAGGQLKPDISAYTTVTTKTDPAFKGTSAAAPHVAGAAALVASINPAMTPIGLRKELESNAVDILPPGKDAVSGAGRLKLGAPPNTVVFQDNFESIKGWTVNAGGTDTATSGKWEHGDPEPTPSPGSTTMMQLGHTPSGLNALVTGRLKGIDWQTHDVDGGKTTIRSPPIPLPAGKTLTLFFMSYLAHDSLATNADSLRVTVLPAGGVPSVIHTELGLAQSRFGSWKGTRVNLSAFAGKSIQLQFEVTDGGGANVVEAAVDDVVIF